MTDLIADGGRQLRLPSRHSLVVDPQDLHIPVTLDTVKGVGLDGVGVLEYQRPAGLFFWTLRPSTSNGWAQNNRKAIRLAGQQPIKLAQAYPSFRERGKVGHNMNRVFLGPTIVKNHAGTRYCQIGADNERIEHVSVPDAVCFPKGFGVFVVF